MTKLRLSQGGFRLGNLTEHQRFFSRDNTGRHPWQTHRPNRIFHRRSASAKSKRRLNCRIRTARRLRRTLQPRINPSSKRRSAFTSRRCLRVKLHSPRKRKNKTPAIARDKRISRFRVKQHNRTRSPPCIWKSDAGRRRDSRFGKNVCTRSNSCLGPSSSLQIIDWPRELVKSYFVE